MGLPAIDGEGEIPRRFRNRDRTLAAEGAGATALDEDEDKQESSNDSEWLRSEVSEKESFRWRLEGGLDPTSPLRLISDSSTRSEGEIFVRATIFSGRCCGTESFVVRIMRRAEPSVKKNEKETGYFGSSHLGYFSGHLVLLVLLPRRWENHVNESECLTPEL